MAKFLKLTYSFNGKPVWIRADMIASLYWGECDEKTIIYLTGLDRHYDVKETPEQILDRLERLEWLSI